MHAVDDGLFNGNLDFADILFLAAAVLFVIAAVMSFPVRHRTGDTAVATEPRAWVWVVGFLGLAAISLAWLVL